jgi:hypothetical protein
MKSLSHARCERGVELGNPSKRREEKERMKKSKIQS